MNASAAARRAGYGAAGARVRGVELMANPEVKDAIAERQAELAAEVELTARDVRDGLLREARTAPEASVRVRAWELLGKHLDFFPKDGRDVNIAVLPVIEGLTFDELKVLAGAEDWPTDAASARAALGLPETGETVDGEVREVTAG